MNTRVRQVTIPRERIGPWLDGFRSRHGLASSEQARAELIITGQDDARAWVHLPFETPELDPDDLLGSLKTHVQQDRRIGCLLIRKGGHAVGIFQGSRLLTSKVGSTYVQGKTKAGGWSQQRYARRRGNQSKKAYADAADEAANILLPEVDTLAAIIAGGDKSGVRAVLEDHRLELLRSLVHPQVLPVADPRLRVLQAFPEQFLAVTIDLNGQA